MLDIFDAILTRSLAPKTVGPILLLDLAIEVTRRGYRATLGFTPVQPRKTVCKKLRVNYGLTFCTIGIACPICTNAGVSMDYKPEHASRALQIIENLIPHVSPHPLYAELAEVLRDRTRWHEAHGLLSRIRTEITLPSEKQEGSWWRWFVRTRQADLDSLFAYVAENAAKTAYNCSGRPAPFDEDSFDWLLKCEEEFNAKLNRS